MKHRGIITGGLLIAVLAMMLCSPLANAATVWDFSGANVALGQSKDFTVSGQTITATAWRVGANGAGYTSTDQQLFARNIGPNDLGLGVCNNVGTGACTTAVDGSLLEIDNNGNYRDVIRLDLTKLALGTTITAASLASVDTGGADIDHYAIFGSDALNPTLIASATVFLLASGTESTGGINPNVPLSGAYKYVYFTTNSGTSGLNGTDDYLLHTVVGTTVPEPSTGLLFGAGLVGLGAWRWRRSRQCASEQI